MKPGGLLIVSTPWQFPTHFGPEDNWRFSASGLRHLFHGEHFEVLECGQRLDVPAEAWIFDTTTGRIQIIQSSYCIARCR